MADRYGWEQQKTVKYAGFWVRAVATILDGFILGIPIAIMVSLLFGWEWVAEDPSRANLAHFLLWAVVTVAFWVNWDGRTPGKKLMAIKIVTYPDRSNLNHSKALLRYVIGYTLSTLIFGLGFVMVAFREDKRGLHDLIAGTCVIHEQ